MLCLRFAARYHEAPGPSAPAPTTARVPSAVWDCPFQQGTFYTCASMRKKALPACWYSKYLKCFRSDLPTRTDDTVLVWPLRVGEMGVGDPKTRDAVLSKYYSRISFISDLLWESAQDISYISRCGLTITISSVLQAAGT